MLTSKRKWLPNDDYPFYSSLGISVWVCRRTGGLEGRGRTWESSKVKADRRSFFPSSTAVRAMPTFIIFYKGQKIDSVAGASPPKLTVRILAFISCLWLGLRERGEEVAFRSPVHLSAPSCALGSSCLSLDPRLTILLSPSRLPSRESLRRSLLSLARLLLLPSLRPLSPPRLTTRSGRYVR